MSRLNILIVERVEGSAAKAENDLRSAGFTSVERCTADKAEESVGRRRPSLVFIESAGVMTVEVCRAVRRAAQPAFVPLLLLTGEDAASVVQGFEFGADDCIHWPYDAGEMVSRVRSMLRIKSLHDELQVLNAQLTEISVRDALTGLYNRRYLFERLSTEVERAVRYGEPLSCIMLDMDAFKPVNDRFGHLVGDELLRRAAEAVRSIPRRIDVVARYGGDEVAVLLPATGLEAAVSVAERICQTVAGRKFRIGGNEIKTTVSIGVSCLDSTAPLSGDELVRRADVALYASKRAGGSRVTVWHAELADKEEKR